MPDRIVSEAFAAFLTSNSEFWSHERLAPRAPGAILIEASQNNHGYLYGVLKIGLILARLRGLRPIACPNVRADRDALDLITSMCPDVVPIRRSFVRQLLQRWPCMLALLAKLRTGADLLEASVEGAFVGRYVYDAIIGRFHVPTVGRLTLSMRLYVLWWVAYFYALKEVVDQNDVRFMVLHDPANICGLLFEICRLRRIPCLNGLNLSIMQIRKYYAIGDFDAHCRQIDTDVLARIPADGEWQRRLDVYLERRVNGRIDDHDVVAAYGESKHVRARADLFDEYQLDPGRPLVVVMAHVFADSPHKAVSRLPRVAPGDGASSRREPPCELRGQGTPSGPSLWRAGLARARASGRGAVAAALAHGSEHGHCPRGRRLRSHVRRDHRLRAFGRWSSGDPSGSTTILGAWLRCGTGRRRRLPALAEQGYRAALEPDARPDASRQEGGFCPVRVVE